MDFRIAHRFACAPEEYWEITRTPEFEESLKGGEVDTTIIETEERGDISYERRRVSPVKPVPAVMAKAIGRDRLSYVQELESNNTTLTTRWKVLSDVLPDKVRCGGTAKVIAVHGGCERVLEGTIEVNVLFVGGLIEKHILTELQRGYDRAADTIARMLTEVKS